MYTIIDFGENPLDVPVKGYTAVFISFQALVVLDNVELELNGDPRRKFKCNVSVIRFLK